jgi:hypothetical protein
MTAQNPEKLYDDPDRQGARPSLCGDAVVPDVRVLLGIFSGFWAVMAHTMTAVRPADPGRRRD